MRGAGGDRVADRQLGQALAERVHVVDGALRAGGPAAGDRGEHVGRGLDRGALHVVQHAADAAELLAAAGAAGAAVHEHRQRRAVAGGLAGVVAVEDQDPAVPRRDAEHDGARDVRVVGDDRADEAALAAGGERDRLVDRVVGQHGAAPGRTPPRRAARPRPGRRAQQDRGQERAALGVGVDDVDVLGVAVHDRRRSVRSASTACGPPRAARGSPARPCGRLVAGSPTVIFASRADDRLDHVVDDRRRAR